jgi:hypothetical protein
MRRIDSLVPLVTPILSSFLVFHNSILCLFKSEICAEFRQMTHFAYLTAKIQTFRKGQKFETLAESFYYINYGWSIITSKVKKIILVMKI